MAEFLNEKVNICEGERVDDTGFGELKLIQKPDEFCYGVDAVILADFTAENVVSAAVRTGRDVKAVDLGTGTGIIPIILSHKTHWESLTGVEVQQGSFYRACRNIRLNDLEGRLSFVNGDVKDFGHSWGSELKGTVDVVTSNPPYTESAGGLKNSNSAKTIARHETTANLEDFIRCAAGLLKNKGDFFMVHRPSRLVDICCLGRKYKLEPKEMCFVSPDANTGPNILLIHMVKGGGRQLKLMDPLYIYNEDGTYTEKLRKCYK
ncbi:MAG: tRNA1(Val) (adenine(37)-N6)-methyltransferase [Firmicutes bacterium]|nr:tRNA1(Val) (adenine(37)-N6)-methyltransferase [Bacillota bacterium]